MDDSTFTISFPEHMASAKAKQCLDQLAESGAEVVPVEQGIFRVTCRKPKILAMVGWLLFHTYMAKTCVVVAVSGLAQNRASEYPKPSSG